MMMQRLAVAGVLVLLLFTPVAADVVELPLVLDFPVLVRALEEHLGATGGEVVLWGTAGGCRSLVLGDPRSAQRDERLELRLRGRARLGFDLFGLCIAPISWEGHLEALGVPTVGSDWQLRLRDVETAIY